MYATALSQFQFIDMILEISYVNHQGDVETNKISVTDKSLHSLFCAQEMEQPKYLTYMMVQTEKKVNVIMMPQITVHRKVV